MLEIKVGSVSTLTFDDYIFVVQRFNNFDETQEFYENYRTICLKEMVKNDFDKEIKVGTKILNFQKTPEFKTSVTKQLLK